MFYLLKFPGRITTSQRSREQNLIYIWSVRIECRLLHSILGACGEPDQEYGGSALFLYPRFCADAIPEIRQYCTTINN